jgi:hypothetical protein
MIGCVFSYEFLPFLGVITVIDRLYGRVRRRTLSKESLQWCCPLHSLRSRVDHAPPP